MPDQEGETKDTTVTDVETAKEEQEDEDAKVDAEKKPRRWKYITKHMKMYPELYRSDVSIHPSYTTLRNLA